MVCDTIRPAWQHNCTINRAKRRNTKPPRGYLNLLTMTAIIRSTSTVIIAMVTILFVAILKRNRQHKSFQPHYHKFGKYLRAIPLSVLLLLSVYPSLSKEYPSCAR